MGSPIGVSAYEDLKRPSQGSPTHMTHEICPRMVDALSFYVIYTFRYVSLGPQYSQTHLPLMRA